MEIYTNTTRPTPGHDKANIFLVIPGANIIVVNATFVVLLFWSNYHATMTCPYYANVLEVLGQYFCMWFNYLVYTGNATTKFWQKCPCHLMQRTVN